MLKVGMIVKDSAGVLVEIENVIEAGEGYFSISGVRLKADLTPDRRKWSQRESVIHTPTYPVEVIRPA